MLSALRNFALTFVISAVIFGVLAYFIVGFVLDTVSEPELIQDGYSDSDDGFYVNKIETGQTPSSGIVAPKDTTKSDETTDETDVPKSEISGSSFNILLIGSDYQPEIFDDYDYEEKWRSDPSKTGFPDKRNRSWGADMLVIVRVDKENRQFVFCPIPRNTRVQVDGDNMQLGDVLSKKGVEFLCGKVTGLTGLQMDYYAHITAGSIANVVDSVGGVTFYIPENMSYEDSVQGFRIDLKQGTNNIDGTEAAQLLRYVGYQNGNVGRMNTTVEFLKAVLAKFTSPTYLDKAVNLYNSVRNNVATDFTADDLINNLDLIFSYSEFGTLTVTYPGETTSKNGVAYFEPKISSAMDMFDSLTD